MKRSQEPVEKSLQNSASQKGHPWNDIKALSMHELGDAYKAPIKAYIIAH